LARQRLSSRVRPFLLRRTKAQVARDLSDRVEEDLYCDMEGVQRTFYQAELKRARRMLLGVQTEGRRTFTLTGETENRGELVRAFQSAEGPTLFLLSLKAGGFGLNLTAASYVMLFDPWWNPAVENQAIDRTHRIGQQQTVIAYRLLIKDSIEEKVRALRKQKQALAEDVLGEERFAQALSLDDLRFLFG
jgi:SNF2 family DNA or RNA helicase